MGAEKKNFKKLDRESIYSVLNNTKKAYKESGDYEKTIYTATSFAYKTAMSKLKKQEYLQLWRYNKPSEHAIDAKRFWGSFYDTDSKLDQGGAMGKLVNKWNMLDNILKSNDLLAFKQKIGASMFMGFSNPSTFNGPVFGGYSDGKWWGTNLNDLV